MNLKKRTAKAWQNHIERHIPEEDWPKVCSVLWWDFINKKNCKFNPGEWWLEQMYSYDWESQYSNKHLHNLLLKIGYNKRLGAYNNGTNQNDRNGEQK